MRLLIADHAATRMGIRMALDGEVDVCAEAGEGEQAIRAAKREQPDICLLAREISGDWVAAVRGISRAAPGVAVVVLAQVRDADDMLEAVRAGAIGYVPGVLDTGQLQRIIAAVAASEAVVPRSMVVELLLELRGGGRGGDSLTGRESQVLGMLRRGHTTATIANQLQIAPVTVRRHISELVHKLGVEDRSALIAPTSRWGGRPEPASKWDGAQRLNAQSGHSAHCECGDVNGSFLNSVRSADEASAQQPLESSSPHRDGDRGKLRCPDHARVASRSSR